MAMLGLCGTLCGARTWQHCGSGCWITSTCSHTRGSVLLTWRCGERRPNTWGSLHAQNVSQHTHNTHLLVLQIIQLVQSIDARCSDMPTHKAQAMPDLYSAPLCVLQLGDVIFSQSFMLQAAHRAALAADTGVSFWHFEQHVDEAVFIPAGCPHQVRNLRSCIKVRLADIVMC